MPRGSGQHGCAFSQERQAGIWLENNLNAKSVSLTGGVRGALTTANSKGYRTLSTGLPGTGLSNRDTKKLGSADAASGAPVPDGAPITRTPRRLSKQIGIAVKAACDAKGISAVELSDRCAEMGHPIHGTALSKIELAELLTLAAAFDVPLITLPHPAVPNGEVEVLPGRWSERWTAAQWFAAQVDVQQVPGRLARIVSAAGSPQVELFSAISAGGQTDVDAAKLAAASSDWSDVRDFAELDFLANSRNSMTW